VTALATPLSRDGAPDGLRSGAVANSVMPVGDGRLISVSPPSPLYLGANVDLSHVGNVLTPAQAANAIYIDFEGRQDQRPGLLGVLYAEGKHSPDQRRIILRHDIVGRDLCALEGAIGLTWPGLVYRYDTSATTVGRSIVNLVRRAKAQDRLIVAWSRHDLDVALKHGNIGGWATDELIDRYRDGKKTARQWLAALRPDVTFPRDAFGGTHKLARYLELTDFFVPPEYGPGLVADNLKRVSAGVANRGAYEHMTPGQQRAWRDVLWHNLYDCFGLRHVVRLAAKELAGLDARIEVSA
jgi:hypothetical protein